MIRKSDTMYFEKAGKENTQKTLQIAKEEALKRGISHIVVASTFGETALAAAQILKGTGINLVVVTHNTGIREPDLQTFDPEVKKKIENMGGKVHTGTMVLRSLGTALKERGSLSYEQTVADTAAIIKANSSNRFFDIKLREYLVKPCDF